MKTETTNTSKNETTETFVMPADVATRLLCNPLNKMTAKQRKRAWAARTKSVSSKAPVLTYAGGGFVRKASRLAKIKKQPRYAADRSKSGGEKLAGKLKGRKFRQLLIWEKRIAARIKVLEKVVATLTDILETTIADKLRQRIENLHAIGGLVQQEIDTRG